MHRRRRTRARLSSFFLFLLTTTNTTSLILRRQPTTKTSAMTMTNGNKSTNSSPRKRLVLVGGGHAHAQVIRALNKASRPDHLDVTLVDVQESASYSGMVPGCIAGTYTPEDTLLHLKPLAKWAGIDFCHDRVIDIDFDRNLIHLDNLHDPIPFDCVSLDIGSKSRGLDECPGAKKIYDTDSSHCGSGAST